jgi:hypothetical protein
MQHRYNADTVEHTLTMRPAELCTLENALRAAIDLYATNAAACDRDNAPQLAEQMRRQVIAVQMMINMIDAE